MASANNSKKGEAYKAKKCQVSSEYAADVDECNFKRLQSTVTSAIYKKSDSEETLDEIDSMDNKVNKTIDDKLESILMYLRINDKKINAIEDRLKKTELTTKTGKKKSKVTCKRITTAKALT